MISAKGVLATVAVGIMCIAADKAGFPKTAGFIAGVGACVIFFFENFEIGDDDDNGGWDDEYPDEPEPGPAAYCIENEDVAVRLYETEVIKND